jgi:hypothetical protein
MRDTLNIEIDSMKQRHFITQDVYKKNPGINKGVRSPYK